MYNNTLIKFTKLKDQRLPVLTKKMKQTNTISAECFRNKRIQQSTGISETTL